MGAEDGDNRGAGQGGQVGPDGEEIERAPQEEAGAVGNGGIALAGLGGCGVEKMDDVGMDLLQRNELEIGCAKGGLEAAAVFEDVFLGVPFGEAKIENSFAALTANTAGLGAEAVDEPGEF